MRLHPFPRWSFLSAALLTLATLGFLVHEVHHSREVIRSFEGDQLATENVCGRITWLDEVLTMSANMAAATGDLAWQERYDAHADRLDDAIAEAHRLAPGQLEDVAAAQIDGANVALVAMEMRAFELVRRGHLAAATDVLTSPDYRANKRTYAQGMERFLASTRDRTHAVLTRQRAHARRTIALVSAVVPLLALSWWLVGRSLLAHERRQREDQRALLENARALERTRQQVEAATQAKSSFLARMSHEIRTPLNGVLGVSAVLGETRLDEDQRQLVDVVRSSGELLLSILDDILDLSKIEAGRLRIVPVPTDVRRLGREAVSLLMPRAGLKGLELRLRVADDVPARVRMDPMRTRQILTNLIGNAIKFTDEGSVTLTIERAADRGEDVELQLTVDDTGIGIAPDRLQSVFESFVQADDSIGMRFGGTGLGLTISRELAERMGGRIDVESEVGVGTRFVVTLPVPVLAREEVQDDGNGPHHRPRWDTHVLIAEDNPVNLLVAQRLVERAGCRVSTAADGAECLARLSEDPADLVLMDCRMPVMDGFEATRRIRARSGARPPIVALTASAFPGDVEACRDAGMDDFLAKPLSFEQLTAVLERVLGAPEELVEPQRSSS